MLHKSGPQFLVVSENGIIVEDVLVFFHGLSQISTYCRAQVVGWPPIRSFRKNSLATTSKNNDEVDGKPGPGALFVKVSMDGAPYQRKVDLRLYATYQELSTALEKMFSCFTLGEILF